jgi:protease-4
MRRRFLHILTAVFVIASFCPLPVRAGDDDKDKNEKKQKKEDQPDPIRQLVEIRIDPFLVTARSINVPLPSRMKTIRDLMERMEKLGKDDSVGAILLDLDGLALPLPDVEELRTAITTFRKSEKKVHAFLNSGDPNGYLLGCCADEIAIAPSGILSLPGLGRLFPFMRGMYQTQGIEYDVITAGAFKYPGFVNQREPNKYFQQEFDEIMDSWFDDYVRMISEGRHLSTEKVREIIDIALFGAQEAQNQGLVDEICYYEDYRDRILRREKFKKGRGAESDLSKITSLQDLLTYFKKEVEKAQESYKAVGPKIAVLHARGPIVDANLGAGFSSMMIQRDPFVETIEEIRKNKTIRAVVLRIDSPGGSAYASDVIWRKLRELDEEKPLVVSMGSVAGSGGYYIACPGRLIFADPTTITGSIGVLAILANQASALNRMDVNLFEMKRGERSLLGAGHRDMLPQDRQLIQDYILKIYDQFLDRVAVGRKMPKTELLKIAGGRVYTGRQALKIGLVDRLGGLTEAIAAVREMADIPTSAEIKLVHYPRPSSLGELAESFIGVTTAAGVVEMARSPVQQITFERQLQFFARHPQPLCWMAMPTDLCSMFDVPNSRGAVLEMLGLPNAGPARAPVPQLP